MSFRSIMLRVGASRSDAKRDAAIPLPEGVTQCRNISYGSFGESSLLDVYHPQDAQGLLPTIVSIHGGGYVYGSKEVYRRYGMDMARRGFAFVNFNYRLAPKWKFPAPLADTNAVLEWVAQNHSRYHLDPDRIILVGDSAGAQLASQYAAIHTNPAYGALFSLKLPRVKIRCLGLFCGIYDMTQQVGLPRRGIALDYLGKHLPAEDPRFRVLEAIGENYPPAFLVTAANDFLRENAEPMCRFLTQKGLTAQWRCYGAPEEEHVGHVFHVNILLPEAVQCNDDSAAFFKKYT